MSLTREDILRHALAITEEYVDQGLDLTLRQVYYQFVGRGLSDSGVQVYKRIGDVLTAARYAGDFPLDWLVDRGRHVQHGAFTRIDTLEQRALREAAGIVRNLPDMLLQTDRWYGQRVHTSVWFEKEALAGVFGPVCDELGVGWFALKGYPSVSALHDWSKRTGFVMRGEGQDRRFRPSRMQATYTEHHRGTAEQCVILYLGDHDPDGWEIPRSAERNLEKLRDLAPRRWAEQQAEAYGWSPSRFGWSREVEARIEDYPDESRLESHYPVTFERIALNMDQIEEYGCPPFEAKVTSARYAGYVEEHDTEDAWELDALEPTVLRDLIRDAVADYFDIDLHVELQDDAHDRRERLTAAMRDPAWDWRTA